MQKITIEQFLIYRETYPVFDVRSPGEYGHAHMPGAISLPLFSDEERAAVGTAYKQESREQAIKIGLDYFGPKMRKMVESAEEHLAGSTAAGRAEPEKIILAYCWRGGMRSSAVAWLLDLYGFKVYTLTGGYKSFRRYALNLFKSPLPLNIVGGFTGSGKTETLKEMEKSGAAVIDLEQLASHKGSAFGNIGLPPQPTQEMFENRLCLELRMKLPALTADQDAAPGSQRPIWIEDESQRIGLVNIPPDFWKTMRSSPVYFMDIPFEERLQHIVEEYGQLDKEKVIAAIGRISSRLGGLETKNAIQFLEAGNTTESFRILLKYYDKWYLKGLHNRESLNSLLVKVALDTVTPLNAHKLFDQYPRHENR
ncbi:MAG: tRNA 2-selenouridine(34) synthase MnmH [Terrimonas sp.]|nr:tRNA 2-selenouridine(34) synthase MnmH [Terrimonas sp.]